FVRRFLHHDRPRVRAIDFRDPDALAQRIEVLHDIGHDFRDERLEALVPIVFLLVETHARFLTESARPGSSFVALKPEPFREEVRVRRLSSPSFGLERIRLEALRAESTTRNTLPQR